MLLIEANIKQGQAANAKKKYPHRQVTMGKPFDSGNPLDITMAIVNVLILFITVFNLFHLHRGFRRISLMSLNSSYSYATLHRLRASAASNAKPLPNNDRYNTESLTGAPSSNNKISNNQKLRGMTDPDATMKQVLVTTTHTRTNANSNSQSLIQDRHYLSDTDTLDNTTAHGDHDNDDPSNVHMYGYPHDFEQSPVMSGQHEHQHQHQHEHRQRKESLASEVEMMGSDLGQPKAMPIRGHHRHYQHHHDNHGDNDGSCDLVAGTQTDNQHHYEQQQQQHYTPLSNHKKSQKDSKNKKKNKHKDNGSLTSSGGSMGVKIGVAATKKEEEIERNKVYVRRFFKSIILIPFAMSLICNAGAQYPTYAIWIITSFNLVLAIQFVLYLKMIVLSCDGWDTMKHILYNEEDACPTNPRCFCKCCKRENLYEGKERV